MSNQFNPQTSGNNAFKKQAPASNNGEGKGLYGFFREALAFRSFVENGVPSEYIGKGLFCFVLLLLYIANSHYSVKTIRKLNQTKREVEELRVDYTTTKAEYMFQSKQSEVAAKVEVLGLKESATPPHTIVLSDVIED